MLDGILMLVAFSYGLATHAALFGYRRAPVGVVHLSRRQWTVACAFAVLPIALIGAIILRADLRGMLVATWGPRAPGLTMLFAFCTLVGVLVGAAPAMAAEDIADDHADRERDELTPDSISAACRRVTLPSDDARRPLTIGVMTPIVLSCPLTSAGISDSRSPSGACTRRRS